MNSKTAVPVFISVLLLSGIVNGEGWTSREWEPVNRNGAIQLVRRRTKEGKSEKKDKKDKSEKSGKKDKEDSKKAKFNFIENGNSVYKTGDNSNHNYPLIDGGFLDEDVVHDFNDIYEGLFQSTFSFGSMSMNHVHPLSASNKMLRLDAASSSSNEIPKPPTTDTEYDETLSPSSQDDARISLALYSLIFSFMDSVIPTRRDDYNELISATKSKFKEFMIQSCESNTTPDLNDFQVEFVKTGVSEFDEIYIVFQSTAIFDSNSYSFLEASQVQNTLGDSLARDEELWMEYITTLQKLNPDNAFSSTVNVAYIKGIPNEKGNIQSTPSSSRANRITYSAAACITILSIIGFVVKTSRDRQDFKNICSHEKESGSRSIESCESTVSGTLTNVSSSIYGKQNESYFDLKDKETKSSMIGLPTHTLTDHRSRMCDQSLSSIDSTIEDESMNDLSERIKDIDNYKTSFEAGTLEHTKEGFYCETRDVVIPGDLIAHDENFHSSNKRWYSLQERQLKTRNPPKTHASRTTGREETRSFVHKDRLTKNNICYNSMHKTRPQLEQARVQLVLGNQLQDRSARIAKSKITKEQEILEGLLRRAKASRLDEDKRESKEKLRAELAIIEAEETARTADELRLKEVRRIAVDRESSELRSRLQSYARRAEKLKLEIQI